jgi:hypothetical protein
MYAVFAGGCLFWFSFPVASRQNIKEMYLVLVISREHFPMPKSWLLQKWSLEDLKAVAKP